MGCVDRTRKKCKRALATTNLNGVFERGKRQEPCVGVAALRDDAVDAAPRAWVLHKALQDVLRLLVRRAYAVVERVDDAVEQRHVQRRAEVQDALHMLVLCLFGCALWEQSSGFVVVAEG